jgi:MarR family transcriptional regulator, organic hydroperoxide resistance regulator
MRRAGRGASDAGARRQARLAPEPSAVALPMLQTLLGYNVRRAHVAMARDFQRHVGQGKIRPVIFSILLLAEAQPGIAQVDLAHKLSLDKASVVALIDRLEGSGLVERRRSTQDRRRQGLFLTPQGLLRLQTLKEEVARHERRFIERYTPVELALLISLLQRIHE